MAKEQTLEEDGTDGMEPEDDEFDPDKIDPVFKDFLFLTAMTKRLVLDMEADKNRHDSSLLEVQILNHIEGLESRLGVILNLEPIEEESGPVPETK